VEAHGEVPAGDWIVLRCAEAHRGWTDASLAPLMAVGAHQRLVAAEIDLDLPVALARMQSLGGHLSTSRDGEGGTIIMLWLRVDGGAKGTAPAPATESSARPTTMPPLAHAQRTPWMGVSPVTADAPPALSGTRPSLDGLRVLLVDDDALVLRTAERLLQRAGANVVTAATAEDAERALDSLAPAVELIVTDVVMPGVSGPALIARRRAVGDMRPVVYMSGYTGDAFSEAALLAEDAVLVAKPFTTATLVAAIREAQGQARPAE
jgi:CheY-like chemotaxis protein